MNIGLNLALRVLAAAWLALSLFACGAGEKPASTATPANAPAANVPPAQAAPTRTTPTPVQAPAPAASTVPLLEQEVAYGEGQKTNLVGFLAMPRDAAEPLPGIIVIHEWWGLNEQIKAMARRLAGEGYVALAVDLYGGATATTPDKAQALMTTLSDRPGIRAQESATGLRLSREVRAGAAHWQHRLGFGRWLGAAGRAAVSRRARRAGHVLRSGGRRSRSTREIEGADARVLRL